MKDCVLITSVIHTTNAPLNYSHTRSIYSHQQRFEQMLETIESVRKYIPDADIMIIECSPDSEYMTKLSEKVEHFMNLKFNETVNLSKEKGKGEAILLTTALSFLEDKYDNIYKLSGRYVLQPTFELSKWKNTNAVMACKTNKYGMENSIHTFFYKIPNDYIPMFLYTLNYYLYHTMNESIENFIAENLKTYITFTDHIGILVRWACYDEQCIY